MSLLPLLETPPSGRALFGEVFTRRWVVDAILDLVDYRPDTDLSAKVLVDPCTGGGAFVTAAVERLLESRHGAGVPFNALRGCVRAFDLQPANVAHCRLLVQRLLRDAGCSTTEASDLAREWVVKADYLLDEGASTSADVVVGNPPYIRIEDLPPEVNAAYRHRWSAMTGRADVYVGFLQRALSTLNPDGRVGFICADRWMRNSYGAPLRRLVANRYAVQAVWTMHDVDAFDSRVSAYPAITVLSRGRQGSAVVADADASFDTYSAAELVAWSRAGDGDAAHGKGYVAHRLPHWFPGHEMWPAGPPGRLAMLEHLKDNFPPLHDPERGTRVGIGVATGADRVFITTDSRAVEPDRLLPLAMVRDVTSGDFAWSGHYLVNPWTPAGSLVDLRRYPQLRSYLDRNGSALRDRFVARKQPASWYRTIDKVNDDLTALPKLLLQDMKATINPVLEPGGHYPHHNLYYVVSKSWDLEVLGGLLLSRIAQAFIEAYCVRMRGGTLRFQAQYLKQVRVPDPATMAADVADRLRMAFRHRDQHAATQAAATAYGLSQLDLD